MSFLSTKPEGKLQVRERFIGLVGDETGQAPASQQWHHSQKKIDAGDKIESVCLLREGINVLLMRKNHITNVGQSPPPFPYLSN